MNGSRGQAQILNRPVPGPPLFAEAPAWKAIGPGWRPVFGRYRDLGFSFEWHDFDTPRDLDWAQSFHPGSVELCLNLEGCARLSDGTQEVDLHPETLAFYYQGDPPLAARRLAAQRHRFFTLEFAPAFLLQNFQSQVNHLHPMIAGLLTGRAAKSQVVAPGRLALTLRQLMDALQHCPVFQPAQELWFRSKALELAAHVFFQPPSGELFCTRTKRLARERVDRAKAILTEEMQNPPPLEALARTLGASPFYLSRQFAQEAGLTMQQFLRQVRMERAAELLRTGECNVTEAALEVGYNSLSHFSTAFHETFGCCPGLYPLQTNPHLRKPPTT